MDRAKIADIIVAQIGDGEFEKEGEFLSGNQVAEAMADQIIALFDVEAINQGGRKKVAEWFMENYPEVCDYHLEVKLKEWKL